MERGVAELRVQVIRSEPTQKCFRRQIQERCVGIRWAWKLRSVKGKQPAALHLHRMARPPFAEDDVELADFAAGDAGVERLRDGVGELWNTERMRRHGYFPASGDVHFGGRCASSRTDQKQFGCGEIGADGSKHALAECAGKSLLRAEQYERGPDRLRRSTRASSGA